MKPRIKSCCTNSINEEKLAISYGAFIAAAIETVQPFGIDVCSGVRTNGNLDEEKLNAFFKAAGY